MKRDHKRTRNRASIRFFVFLLPAVTLWSLADLEPIALMTAIAASIYLFIKTHSLLLFRARGEINQAFPDVAAWFFGWPGMNAAHFFVRGERRRVEWDVVFVALSEFALGAILLFVIAPRTRDSNDMLCGWCALVGMALMLHFGFFRILAAI